MTVIEMIEVIVQLHNLILHFCALAGLSFHSLLLLVFTKYII